MLHQSPMSTTINLDTLITTLNLNVSEILNIYQFGSRVYGTATQSSDWDFVIVVQNSSDKIPSNMNGFTEIHSKNITGNIYHLSRFQKRIDDNELQAFMCVFLDKKHKWMEKVQFSPKILYRKLLLSVYKEASRHFHGRAQKYWKSDPHKSKKFIIHAIRDLLFGMQIVEFGKIVDYTAANRYFREILSENQTEWNYYRDKYEPLYEQLLKAFSDAIEPPAYKKIEGELDTIQFVKQYGLDVLEKYFSVKHVKLGNMILLDHTKNESPNHHQITHECCGLVLNHSSVVMFPFVKFYNSFEHYAARINWKSCQVSVQVGGIQLGLFWCDNAWYIASRKEFIGYWSSVEKCWKSVRETALFKAFKNAWNHYEIPENKNWCFVFVFYAKNVMKEEIIKYEKDVLLLCGCRDLKTLKEVDLNQVAYNWEQVKRVDSIVSQKQTHLKTHFLNPIHYKGLVIRDDKFRRIKIKAPQYLALQKLLKEELTENEKKIAMIDIIVRIEFIENGVEFLNYYSQFKELYTTVKSEYDEICKAIQQEHDKLKSIKDKKQLAMEKNIPWKSILLNMRKESIDNVKLYFHSQQHIGFVYKLFHFHQK